MSDLWRDNRDAETRPLELVQQDAEPSPRTGRLSSSLRGRLDPFWAVVCVVAVISAIFVAIVSYSSMSKVGPQAATSEAKAPHLARQSSGPAVIVQLASYPTRARAEAAAQKLVATGTPAKVLTSSDYRPLTPGYFVVYLGPLDDTTAGHAQARREQSRFKGALIRTISRR